MSRYRGSAVAARLVCEPLEDRLTPAIDLNPALPAPGDGSAPVSVAVGDLTGDGAEDIIAVTPANGQARVIDGRTGEVRESFFAYAGFAGSIRVAVADVNADGYADIVTAASRDGHIKVFSGSTGAVEQSFLAYPGYEGVVSVDVHIGNALPFTNTIAPLPASIITRAAGNGHMKVFDARTATETASFQAYQGYAGAVRVAFGDFNSDGVTDVATAAAVNGHVCVFDGRTQTQLTSFQAYPGYVGFVELTAENGITTRAPNGHVKTFAPLTGVETASFIDLNRDGAPDEVTIQ